MAKKKFFLYAVGAALAAGCLSGCSFGWTTSYIYENGDNYTAGDREISDKIEAISVDYISGDVTIVESESDNVVITETSKTELDDQRKVHSWVDGTTLYVRYCASAKGLRLNNLGKKLTVAVPASSVLNEIELKVSSGNIDAVCKANKIKYNTSSGNVKLVQTGKSERISAHTSSGNVSLSVEEADELNVSVSSGNISLKAGSIKALSSKTSSGNSEYTLAKAPGSSDIDASSGNITIYLPEKTDITASMKTSSGKVSYEQAFSKEGNTYVCGNGENEMKVHASSGNINMKILAQ